MRKKLRPLLATVVAAGLLAACGSNLSPNKHSHTGRWWEANLRGTAKASRRDMTKFYETFDRHFFNYDWNDPYID